MCDVWELNTIPILTEYMQLLTGPKELFPLALDHIQPFLSTFITMHKKFVLVNN